MRVETDESREMRVEISDGRTIFRRKSFDVHQEKKTGREHLSSRTHESSVKESQKVETDES